MRSAFAFAFSARAAAQARGKGGIDTDTGTGAGAPSPLLPRSLGRMRVVQPEDVIVGEQREGEVFVFF
jgi:hypothetical protein